LTPPKLKPRYNFHTRSSRPGTYFLQLHKTYLSFHDWPSDVQDAFLAFQTWATAPLVPGRPARLRKRQVTLDDYRGTFAGYFGYLHHTLQLVPTFEHLFDI